MAERSDPELRRLLGRRLRAIRLQQGLTLADVAARADVSPLTVSKTEQGQNFTIDTLLRVLRVLRQVELVEDWLPAPAASPIEFIERQPAPAARQRAPRRPDG